jgi:hypothetical protein
LLRSNVRLGAFQNASLPDGDGFGISADGGIPKSSQNAGKHGVSTSGMEFALCVGDG